LDTQSYEKHSALDTPDRDVLSVFPAVS
jgi:hypothetical protein